MPDETLIRDGAVVTVDARLGELERGDVQLAFPRSASTSSVFQVISSVTGGLAWVIRRKAARYKVTVLQLHHHS